MDTYPNMTDKKPTPEPSSPDLSTLTDFQFGPAWARQREQKTYSDNSAPAHREYKDRFDRNNKRGDGKFSPRGDGQRRDFGNRGNNRSDWGDRRREGGRDNRKGHFDRERPERAPLPEPTAGLRVELRPVDMGLAACSAEVNKHKRSVSLFDFAKVIMSKRDRYDLVFMKQEGGPQIICSKKGDHAYWLTRDEALSYIWKSPWFAEFYDISTQEVEPPKGEFKSIGKCVITGELVGPVNWHGYQSALVNLHRSKFSNMDFDRFKSKIQVETGDEIVQEWLASVSTKTVWTPKRENADGIVLADASSVEKDFSENHFDEVYESADKVFINGAVQRQSVSGGIWAHIVKLADVTRKHPSMLIPNLCHGLARHNMPIFKWKGGYHTGPSRPKVLLPETVLADRLMSIIEWVKNNSGKRADLMLKELGGDAAPAQEIEPAKSETAKEGEEPVTAESAEPAEAPRKEVSETDLKRQEIVKDLFWLCDQGYVIIFADGKVNMPRPTENQAPQQPREGEAPKKPKAAKKTARKEKPAEAKVEKGAEEKAEEVPEAPVKEEVPAEVTEEAAVPAELPEAPVVTEAAAEETPEGEKDEVVV